MSALPRSLPLCIDGRMLVPGGTGVSRYAQMLARTLPLVGGRPMVLTDRDGGRLRRGLVALTGRDRRVHCQSGGHGSPIEVLSGDNIFRAAQAYFTLYGRLMTVRSDMPTGIMHWTYPVPLRMAGWINMYTIHDIIPIDQPRFSNVNPVRLCAILNLIMRSADRIITVSSYSRKRILSRFDIAPDLVVNCYQAVDISAFTDNVEPAHDLLSGDYFLYMGMDEPRKNLDRLIAAYIVSGVHIPLVLVGPSRGEIVSSHSISGPGIFRLPYLPDRDLVAVVSGATALLFPSLAEGFGLPIVEAMAAGVPVLTSAYGAVAEIAGDAALRVDPDDTDAIMTGIVRLATDRALRSDLVVRGRSRASRFCPARFAAQLRQVYGAAIIDARSRYSAT